jgi:exodeoxyribonuclease-3
LEARPAIGMKVLSYNIRDGGDGGLRETAHIIRTQQPHAVALLEANIRANAENLAENLEMHLAFGEANSKYHIAWLSCFAIRRQENHRLPVLSKTLLEIELAWEEQEEPKGEWGTLRLFATHLGSSHDAHQPLEEIPAILDALRPLRSQPHLLVGDFNALCPGDPVGTPPREVEKWGEAVEGAPREAIQLILEAGYVDCYRRLHPRSRGYTYPADHPWMRLDYIFASPSMAARLRACDIVRGGESKRASDHLAIWAEFR